MKRLAARGIALLVTFGVLGAQVNAAQGRPFDPWNEALYSEAVELWEEGEPPWCGSLVKELVHPPSIDGASGTATQPAPESSVDCTIRIAEGPKSTCTQRAIMLHEVGHLLGRAHSADPENIMYPQTGFWHAAGVCYLGSASDEIQVFIRRYRRKGKRCRWRAMERRPGLRRACRRTLHLLDSEIARTKQALRAERTALGLPPTAPARAASVRG